MHVIYKTFLIFALLLLNAAPSFSVSSLELDKIFTKLYPQYTLIEAREKLFQYQLKNKSLDIVISNSRQVNAHVIFVNKNKAEIYISELLISKIQNEHELAFVIAHEMSHVLHEDYPLPELASFTFSERQKIKISDYKKSRESIADFTAKKLLESSGFNAQQGSLILGRLDQGEAAEHSSKFLASHRNLKLRMLSY